MSVNQYVNKLVKDGVTKFDLTVDTVTPATLAEGVTAHNAAGEQITGTMQGGLDVNIEFSGNTIPYAAFKSAQFSGAVVISDRILSIKSSAFYLCSSLTSVTIGNGVTTIGSEAFRSCYKLTSVTIGNGVTSISSDAFSNSSMLTTITIDKPQDSVSGAPWGATNATVVWTG